MKRINKTKVPACELRPTTILEKAHKIVHERAEEDQRRYGPFGESMERAAKMASLMGPAITAEQGWNFMIALKLTRESYGHKEDNFLDAVAYISALNDYKNDKVNTTTSEQVGNKPANG